MARKEYLEVLVQLRDVERKLENYEVTIMTKIADWANDWNISFEATVDLEKRLGMK